ncbi:hypothetical protein LQ318_10440 [Aliifodinibius salicampi]|uniref:ATP-dependent DNA ligase family profile domain-containing protein n=1 Tax=Fodinibius salicampi TaxID=1920655 RepID=A0ABT3PZN7_9BACT|nr:hypothetical protein [Fodinibius salicampi]MCW9713325.1 hypothetical protein [Fodinibius salicampi]
MSDTFQQWAENAQQISEAPDAPSKVAICANYFRSLHSDTDIKLAAQFLGEGPMPALSAKRATAGSRTYSMCAARFCEVDYQKVFKPCKKAIGSAAEAIEKLMENIETAREKRVPANLSLVDISDSFEKLSKHTTRTEKQKILASVWRQMTPIEIKFYIHLLSQKTPGIGLGEQQLITVLANVFDQETKEVRYAHAISGSIGKTAVLCKKDALDEALFSLFQPLPFMFASSSRDNLPHDLSQYVAEENFSGLRTQLHIRGNKIRLYAENGDDVSRFFPDIVQFFAKRELPETVLDGEICVFKENEIHPYQILHKRLKHTAHSEEIQNKFPALFIASDILYAHPQPTINQQLAKRRTKLEALAKKYHFPISNQFTITDEEEVNQLSKRAVARGNEGLILKDINSKYNPNHSGIAWITFKTPAGTLHTVIMYAHTAGGSEDKNYSNFTLGIRVAEDERYEEEFIPIGKTEIRCPDDKIQQFHKRIEELTVETYGPTLGLIPEIVVELKFDDIQVNKRTKANYKLKLPRFKKIRWDLGPDDIDTLKTVEQLYRQIIDRDRLKQSNNPSFHFID